MTDLNVTGQGRPLCAARFLDDIGRMTGTRREVRLRGRPKKSTEIQGGLDSEQGSLDL